MLIFELPRELERVKRLGRHLHLVQLSEPVAGELEEGDALAQPLVLLRVKPLVQMRHHAEVNRTEPEVPGNKTVLTAPPSVKIMSYALRSSDTEDVTQALKLVETPWSLEAATLLAAAL